MTSIQRASATTVAILCMSGLLRAQSSQPSAPTQEWLSFANDATTHLDKPEQQFGLRYALAVTMGQAGDFEGYSRCMAEAESSVKVAKAGQRTTQSAEFAILMARLAVPYQVVEFQLARGDLAGAKTFIEHIAPLGMDGAGTQGLLQPRDEALLLLAIAQAKAGNAAAGRKTLDEAVNHMATQNAVQARVRYHLACGDMESARQVAAEVQKMSVKKQALRMVAEAQAKAGDLSMIQQTLAGLDEEGTTGILAQCSITLARAGKPKDAEILAKSIKVKYRHDIAMREVIKSYVSRGDFAEAWRLVAGLSKDDFSADIAFETIALGLAAAGKRDDAMAAVGLIRKIEDFEKPEERQRADGFRIRARAEADVVSALAEYLAEKGDVAGVKAVVAQRQSAEVPVRAAAALAKAQFKAGDRVAYAQTVQTILKGMGAQKDWSFSHYLITMQLASDDMEGAIASAKAISDPLPREVCLLRIITHQLEDKNRSGAVESAKLIASSRYQIEAAARIVMAQVQVGQHTEARAFVKQLASTEVRAWAALAGAWATLHPVGNADELVRLLFRPIEPRQWSPGS